MVVKVVEPNLYVGRWSVGFEILSSRVDENSGQVVRKIKHMRVPPHNGTAGEWAANFGIAEGDIVDLISIGTRGLRMRKLSPEYIAEKGIDEAELISDYQNWLVFKEWLKCWTVVEPE